MTIVHWDPSRELSLLQGDVNRLFGRFFAEATGSAPTSQSWNPPIDLSEEGEHFVLRADLPGLERDDVEIELRDRTLTITGARHQERRDEHASFVRMERSYGTFLRTLTLPKGVEGDAIEASLERGVLELRIPKPAQVQPRRIEIGGARPAEVEAGEAVVT